MPAAPPRTWTPHRKTGTPAEPEADPADIPAVSTVPVVRTPGGAAAVADLDDRVAAALRHALAPNTWRAYAADWRHWSAWARSL